MVCKDSEVVYYFRVARLIVGDEGVRPIMTTLWVRVNENKVG